MGHVGRGDGPLGRLAACEMPTGRHGPNWFGERYFAPNAALLRGSGVYIGPGYGHSPGLFRAFKSTVSKRC